MKRIAVLAVLLSVGASAPAAAAADCVDQDFSASADGYLTARTSGGSGDWNLTVRRRSGGPPVAASSYRGAVEVASGFVARGDDLTIAACRASGRGPAPAIDASLEPVEIAADTSSIVRVSAPTPARKGELVRLGVELTEHGGDGFVDVVLHDAGDAAKLRQANFPYTVRVADVGAQDVRDRAADAGFGAGTNASLLPSGRTTYRHLADYSADMASLAAANPGLVKPFTLPHLSLEGRPIEGIEITTDPAARDGKPVFLMLGLHHANEWPSGEQAIEWAYELVNGYNAGDARTRQLVATTRTIIVPVVNADGFNFSREAPTGTAPESHRKNCRPPPCASGTGVDLNRNYGDLWGDIGSSSSPSNESFRGSAPFSEPEAQNIRELIAGRQVVVMITNHTSGRLILRQPGLQSQPPTPDEPVYRALGAAFAAENGYSNQFSYQLYDHTGTTDGWSYYSTGGLGYVFEIATAAHPPYADQVAEYEGTNVSGGGNREAYYVAAGATADSAKHAVLKGNAPPGAILRLAKSFNTRVSVGSPVPDRLDSTMEVPASGSFEWHVNQSARPLVPSERWTLTCEIPEGTPRLSRQIDVVRGQTLLVNPCEPDPAPAEPTPAQPPGATEQARPDSRTGARVKARMSATFNGRSYRARVAGSVTDRSQAGPAGQRCPGMVTLTVSARGHVIDSRRAPVDATCGFERTFRFVKSDLPRSLRKKGARVSLRGLARYPGSAFLLPGEAGVVARVHRR